MIKALIVDDDRLQRKLLSIYLDTIANIDYAENGAEGVDLAIQAISNGAPYELICLDITMPVMDGLSALKNIRELESQYGAKRSLVFMISASSLPQDMIEAIEVGDCDDYIVKPIIKDSFIKLLSKHALI